MKTYKLEAYREEQIMPFMGEKCGILDFSFLCKKAIRCGAVRIVITEVK